MDMSYKPFGFEIQKTDDQSPTLRIVDGTERGGESMHHMGGAYSETSLIYGQALQYGFQNNRDPVVVSLGLGLGYIEILAVAFSLLHNSSSFLILSYEKVEGLKNLFSDYFLLNKQSETYGWIVNETAKKFNLDSSQLKKAVTSALTENRLVLKNDFVKENNNILFKV